MEDSVKGAGTKRGTSPLESGTENTAKRQRWQEDVAHKLAERISWRAAYGGISNAVSLPIPNLDPSAKNELTGRPLAEPPVFEYDAFIREYVPSDLRFQLLFPDRQDIGKMTTFKDAYIEANLVKWYALWVAKMMHQHEASPKHDYYSSLWALLKDDEEDLEIEWLGLLEKTHDLSALAWWEFNFLDDDLGTTRIEKYLAKDDRIFASSNWPHSEEARQKYQHLFPEGASDEHKYYWQRKQEPGRVEMEEDRERARVNRLEHEQKQQQKEQHPEDGADQKSD